MNLANDRGGGGLYVWTEWSVEWNSAPRKLLE